MRTYKFRMWVTNENYLSDEEKPHMDKHFAMETYLAVNDEISEFQLDGNILMQYTGLKDMDGAEIYEGDIVDFHGRVAEVFFDKGRKGYYLRFYDVHSSSGRAYYTMHLLSSQSDDLIVVGNIFENKELRP